MEEKTRLGFLMHEGKSEILKVRGTKKWLVEMVLHNYFLL